MDFRTTLIGAAFGIFAFVGIGFWSLVLATPVKADSSSIEDGVAGIMFYLDRCRGNDIPDSIVSASKIYQQNHRYEVQDALDRLSARVRKSDFGLVQAIVIWCHFMKESAQKNFAKYR